MNYFNPNRLLNSLHLIPADLQDLYLGPRVRHAQRVHIAEVHGQEGMEV